MSRFTQKFDQLFTKSNFPLRSNTSRRTSDTLGLTRQTDPILKGVGPRISITLNLFLFIWDSDYTIMWVIPYCLMMDQYSMTWLSLQQKYMSYIILVIFPENLGLKNYITFPVRPNYPYDFNLLLPSIKKFYPSFLDYFFRNFKYSLIIYYSDLCCISLRFDDAVL